MPEPLEAQSDPVLSRLSQFQQAALSFYWFGIFAQGTAFFLFTMPSQALTIGGESAKGRTLGLVFFLVNLISMVFSPLFGALSDRWGRRWGRRLPWVLVGTVVSLLGILPLMHYSAEGAVLTLPVYLGAYVWIFFWSNVACSPYSALIPDRVPLDQRGSASGWYGLMMMLGNFAGAGSALLFSQNGKTHLPGIFAFTSLLLVVTMAGTVLFVKENRPASPSPRFQTVVFFRTLFDPLRGADFRWVFLIRFFTVMGTATVQGFLMFYLRDVVKEFTLFGRTVAENPESAVSYFLMAIMVGAVVSTLAAGALSDRFGRKSIVYVAGSLQALVPLAALAYHPFWFVVVLGLVFGLGYGGIESVIWALAGDVLPSRHDHAKDMGVWGISLTLPWMVATPIAGFLVDRLDPLGGTLHLGYLTIFTLASICFLLGTLLVKRVNKSR